MAGVNLRRRGCYHSTIGLTRTAIAATAVALVAVGTLAAPASAPARPSTETYRGAGAWIDIWDARILADPVGTVTALSLNGVRTIYVETANYRIPPTTSVANPVGISALIDAAHANGMKVVAWYLAGFVDLRRDLKRSLDAIRFTTAAAGRFDSFALDIEAGLVRSIAQRNRRARLLSSRIRRAVGKQYALGAIVPDQRSTSSSLPSLWPRFPYRRLRRYYDVFLPMAYSTNRGRGSSFVYGYTAGNIGYVRFATGDPVLPVHVIGGLADRLSSSEDTAVVQAAQDVGALGASFYKVRLSGTGEWQALQLGFPEPDQEYDR